MSIFVPKFLFDHLSESWFLVLICSSGSRARRVLAADRPAPAPDPGIPLIERGPHSAANGESGQSGDDGHGVGRALDWIRGVEEDHQAPGEEVSSHADEGEGRRRVDASRLNKVFL